MEGAQNSCLHGYTPHLHSVSRLCLLQVVQLWRKELSKINAKAAESLADPDQYSNLFPDLDLALKAEQRERQQRKQAVPAGEFQDYEGSTLANLIEEIQGQPALSFHVDSRQTVGTNLIVSADWT